MSELQFKGYAVHDTAKYNEFTVIDFEPKTFGPSDVEISIHYCGVCASDVHTITGGWNKDIILPMITGHEIAGTVHRVGENVTEFKVGDRVGVGAQVWSCLECNRCKSDNENYCNRKIGTYNGRYQNGDIAHGGYSTAIRAHERFVFKVPDALPLEQAASMMCGGLTAFSPLVRNGCGPGKKVGIVGIGGLGHYALQFARALGADEVVAISHSDSKREDALKMGATKFVAYGKDSSALREQISNLDLIVSTVGDASGLPINDLLSVLDVHGRLISVGLPENPLEVKPQMFIGSGTLFGATHIGSKKECIQMLDLAVEKGVRAWVVPYAMKDAGKAVTALKEGTGGPVKYRQVLKQDIIPPSAPSS